MPGASPQYCSRKANSTSMSRQTATRPVPTAAPRAVCGRTNLPLWPQLQASAHGCALQFAVPLPSTVAAVAVVPATCTCCFTCLQTAPAASAICCDATQFEFLPRCRQTNLFAHRMGRVGKSPLTIYRVPMQALLPCRLHSIGCRCRQSPIVRRRTCSWRRRHRESSPRRRWRSTTAWTLASGSRTRCDHIPKHDDWQAEMQEVPTTLAAAISLCGDSTLPSQNHTGIGRRQILLLYPASIHSLLDSRLR